MNKTFASFGLVMLVACGGSDPLAPGSGSDPGTGTSTLLVDGRISSEPHAATADKATDFSTDFSIRLGLNNAPVSQGTVTIKSRDATTTLTYQGDNNGLGEWVGTAANYDEVYQLDVVSGDDTITGVIIDGPDVHHFTAPTAGASLDSTVANDVKWDRSDEADTATFRAENLDRLAIPDSGTYSMPPNAMKADKDQTRTNTLDLTRTNSVVPAGAVAGSSVAVSITNSIDVVALANPAL